MIVEPIYLVDSYKVGHIRQYPDGTSLVYSNFTPRSSRIPEDKEMVFFGLQYILKEYLIKQYNESFFSQPKDKVVEEYAEEMADHIGTINVDHIADLHDIGHLPVLIKALPEGTAVPLGTPAFTVVDTSKKFFWLTNYLETMLSSLIWKPSTSATTSRWFYRECLKYAMQTGGDLGFVPFQCHDFSYRGMSGTEDACMSGAGHLTYFKGTDTIPAIRFIKKYYDGKKGIGHSVPATEHSCVMAGGEVNERDTIIRLITEIYPNGFFSFVSDTWDFWNNITNILPSIKDLILARDGKYVVRPDSGVPHKIINGDPNAETECEKKGLIRCLEDTFGSTTNQKGFRVLNPKVGWIYGDGINRLEFQKIMQGMVDNGFATTCGVLGLGSYTYEYTTRDTYGTVCKATYCENNGVGHALHKSPKTGMWKKSHKGLLRVNADLSVSENVTWAEEQTGMLQPVFKNGVILKNWQWDEIVARALANAA